LLVAAAIVTLAAVPARAEHVPHWYENGQLIVGSISVQARGTIIFEPPSTGGLYLRCRNVVADWTLTNPSGGEAGIGELTSLSGCSPSLPRSCAGASAEIVGLPQRAPLTGKRPPTEKFEGVSIGAECSTGAVGTFGTLYVTTHHGGIHLTVVESCIELCHRSVTYGTLKLAKNITAK
jgi:hypothetical protein